MPTFFATNHFKREFCKLTPSQQALFMIAVSKFIDDLRKGQFRKSLRVKRYQGEEGIWEMTWADDGRALFTYGASVRPGQPHVVWLRVGGHEIFE
jgi:hypothetical protein